MCLLGLLRVLEQRKGMHIRRAQLFAASFHSLPLVVPEKQHFVSPMRFTEAAFPAVLITRLPDGDASAWLRVGGAVSWLP